MAEKTFLGNKIIRYAFYSKCATLAIFRKTQVFSGKPNFFKKPQILNSLRNLSISVHTTADLLQFGGKKFHGQKVFETGEI